MTRLSKVQITLTAMLLGASQICSGDQEAVEKFISDYERGQTVNGQVENANRVEAWSNASLTGQKPSSGGIASLSSEVSQTSIAGGVAVSASNLSTLFQRISSSSEYLDFYNKIHQTGDQRGLSNYGHEGDLTDLEIRAEDLRQFIDENY